MGDFPGKVIGKHAYVVLEANPEIVANLSQGTVIFDRPYFPGVHSQAVLNEVTGDVEWAYTTRWLFKVRAFHTRVDLDEAADRARQVPDG